MKGLIPAVALLSLTGCGTTLNMVGGRCGSGSMNIYGGIQFDASSVAGGPLAMLCGLIDLPFSLVADTFTLPWTIPAAQRRAPEPTRPKRPWQDAFEKDLDKMTPPSRREK